MSASLATRTDDVLMRQWLEPMLALALSDGHAVRGIAWERFPLATSYAAHVATVTLASGRARRVFVKDFSSTVRPKDAPQQRREREVRVYRDLLDGAGLGTARYYGSLLDGSLGWLWLMLEFVDGTPVGYCEIERSWAPAAGALGRLHGHFATHPGAPLDGCDFLVQHTPEFFWSKAELASRAVTAIAPALLGDLEAIVERYAPVVDIMAAQPRTLIHGGCRSTNILVNVADDPSRACIIDWEEAAYGAPLYDLAYLLDGIEPPTLDPLLDAYRREALAYDIALPARREMAYVMDCFRLHMILLMLGQAVLKRYDAAAVAKLLAIGTRLAAKVRGPVRQ